MTDDRRSPLLSRWDRRMRAEGLAMRTITERTRIVTRVATMTRTSVTDFTTEQLIDYLADLSAGTRQTYYSALAAWHQWLLAEGLRADNPMTRLRRPRAPRRKPHPVSTLHIERLLNSGIRRRTKTAILLCAYQGLRVHEAAKLRGQDVDLIAETLRVVGKGGVEELLPLHPLIAKEAHAYPRRGYWFPSHKHPGRPISGNSLSSALSRAMGRAGVPGTAHSLRHWLATEMVRNGVNARIIQTIMRHASLATLAIYTRVDPEQQRSALRGLPSAV